MSVPIKTTFIPQLLVPLTEAIISCRDPGSFSDLWSNATYPSFPPLSLPSRAIKYCALWMTNDWWYCKSKGSQFNHVYSQHIRGCGTCFAVLSLILRSSSLHMIEQSTRPQLIRKLTFFPCHSGKETTVSYLFNASLFNVVRLMKV